MAELSKDKRKTSTKAQKTTIQKTSKKKTSNLLKKKELTLLDTNYTFIHFGRKLQEGGKFK